jgi:hypothetical protein
MPLDMFARDRDEAVAYAARASAPDFPVTFGESFRASWADGFYFGQSIARQNTRSAVLNEIADEIFARTGDDPALRWEAMFERPEHASDLDFLNARIAKRREQDPTFNYADLTEDEISRRMQAKSRGARQEAAELAARERTTGGVIGGLAGGAASGIVDPVNVVAFPLAAPTSLGILGTALTWGVIAGGTQTGIELAGAPYREEIQPGYMTSFEPVGNVIAAAGFGAVLGGGIKGAATLWSRAKTGQWPQSVRDAGNVVESENHIADTNPFTSARGEAVHRDALTKAVDDVMAGRPVDVDTIVPPELQAEYQARFTSIDEARQRAIETRAPEDAGDVAFELQQIARQAGHALDRTEADRIATRLIGATDDEARAILDEFLVRPRTLGETLPDGQAVAARPAAPLDQGMYGKALADEGAPARTGEAMRDTNTDDTVLRNLDRLRAERGDIAIPVGETIGTDGRAAAVMRNVDDMLAEADAREIAAREIIACVGPQPLGAA